MAGQQNRSESAESVGSIAIVTLTHENFVEARTGSSTYRIDNIENDDQGGVSGEVTRFSDQPYYRETSQGLLPDNTPIGRCAIRGLGITTKDGVVEGSKVPGEILVGSGLWVVKIDKNGKPLPYESELVTTNIKLLMLGRITINGVDERR